METSVLIIVRNEGPRIGSCLAALLAQTTPPGEIIVVDDHSRDGTRREIEACGDPRIRLLPAPQRMGMAALRNLALASSRGQAVFFTDGDCRPDRHWLEEGLRTLRENNAAGVEGLTFYECPGMTGLGDCGTHQFAAGEFMTCNSAYRRGELERVGGFDPAFRRGHEDRDLAFRIGTAAIVFNRHMIVAHQRKLHSPRALWRMAERAADMVYFQKKHGRQHPLRGRILYPGRLLTILFPPLLLFKESIRSARDIAMLPAFYAFAVRERLLIWRAAWKQRMFIV
jgi:glycosyltransferase involved in cell wall biosynthesis